jgi:hypothetical protein
VVFSEKEDMPTIPQAEQFSSSGLNVEGEKAFGFYWFEKGL